jgi:uncharacterized surface protein with fasciclin (FAS1) repeats
LQSTAQILYTDHYTNEKWESGMTPRNLLGLGAACLIAVASPAFAQMAPAKADIVDTAVSAGQFKTLAAALSAAGLVSTLKGPGPFTVFAPTDAAFAKLPAGTVESLLKPENKAKLVSILTYHVVAGKVMSAGKDGRRHDRKDRRHKGRSDRKRRQGRGG